jgi:hypothetical protein
MLVQEMNLPQGCAFISAFEAVDGSSTGTRVPRIGSLYGTIMEPNRFGDREDDVTLQKSLFARPLESIP